MEQRACVTDGPQNCLVARVASAHELSQAPKNSVKRHKGATIDRMRP